MPKSITQYRCLLISPSDLEAERDALTNLVNSWNAQIGRSLNIQVELVKWESHGTPDLSAPAQDILNQQIVDDCDLGIGLFWSRLGTKTERHDSASLEEIERLSTAGRRVMVYFKTAPLPNDLEVVQLSALRKARDVFEKRGLLGEFNNVSDLREKVQLHLTSALAAMLSEDRSKSEASPSPIATIKQKPDVKVRVRNGITNTELELIIYTIENHSPLPVYLKQVGIMTRDDRVILVGIDIITGEFFGGKVLNSGQKFDFHTTASHLATGEPDFSKLKYVYAMDEIGRMYEGSEEELARCLDLEG